MCQIFSFEKDIDQWMAEIISGWTEVEFIPKPIDVPAFLAAVDSSHVNQSNYSQTIFRQMIAADQITMDNLDLIIYAARSYKAELSSRGSSTSSIMRT